MLLLIPPYAITDLAHEHLEGRLPSGRFRPHDDPDKDVGEITALQPDPLFMAIRHIVTSGPIGWLWRWNDHRIEAREDRIHASRVDDTERSVARPEPLGVARDIDDNRPDRKIAA